MFRDLKLCGLAQIFYALENVLRRSNEQYKLRPIKFKIDFIFLTFRYNNCIIIFLKKIQISPLESLSTLTTNMCIKKRTSIHTHKKNKRHMRTLRDIQLTKTLIRNNFKNVVICVPRSLLLDLRKRYCHLRKLNIFCLSNSQSSTIRMSVMDRLQLQFRIRTLIPLRFTRDVNERNTELIKAKTKAK